MSSIEDVGVAIHVLRVIRELSQGELAEASGVRNSSISNYERGKSVPKLETIQKLAGGLRVPLSVVEEAQGFIEWVRSRSSQGGPGAPGDRTGPDRRSSAGADGFPPRDPEALQEEVERLSAEFGRLSSRLVRLLLERVTVDILEQYRPGPETSGTASDT